MEELEQVKGNIDIDYRMAVEARDWMRQGWRRTGYYKLDCLESGNHDEMFVESVQKIG